MLMSRAPCLASSARAGPAARPRAAPSARVSAPSASWAAGRAARPSRGLVAASAGAPNIVQVTGEQLEAEIQNRDRPLIVDFYATWCGPCVLLAKELEQVAAELGDGVRILKIDTDENPDISTQLQIQGLPTLIFVGTDATRPALRTEGLLPAATIREIVETELQGQGAGAGGEAQ